MSISANGETHPIIRQLDSVAEGVMRLADHLTHVNDRLGLLAAQVERLEDENRALKKVTAVLMEQGIKEARRIREAQAREAQVQADVDN